jgi:hypothetical protein
MSYEGRFDIFILFFEFFNKKNCWRMLRTNEGVMFAPFRLRVCYHPCFFFSLLFSLLTSKVHNCSLFVFNFSPVHLISYFVLIPSIEVLFFFYLVIRLQFFCVFYFLFWSLFFFS